MASTIQTQTISSVTDQCICLAASQFGRPHGYGGNWTKLRIGLNWNVETTGAAFSGMVLRVGLCSGTASMPGDGTTTNSYGLKFTGSWAYYGGGYYINSGTGNLNAFSKVGATETLSSNLSNTTQQWMLWAGNMRGCWFLDIAKGSPYTFTVFAPNTNSGQTDCTPAQFLALAGQQPPSRTLYVYNSYAGGTGLTVSEGTYGILDTVYVGWNLLSPRIFIGNLAVVRLA